MKVSKNIYNKIFEQFGLLYTKVAGVDPKKMTEDVLSPVKPREQLELLVKYIPDHILRAKKLLEVGSGFGVFNIVARTEFGVDAWGVEPSNDGFGGSYEICVELLKENGLSTDQVKNAVGESLPFPDSTFDIVYSTNVLEHTNSPEKVLSEAIRVCKKGGIIQIIVPSYGSFFDGHYNCFYIPYQPKWFWKLWLKYILRRDVSVADTLRTEINYFSIKKYLKPFISNKEINVITFGEEVFVERMEQINFSVWGGLDKIKKWIEISKMLKLNNLIARFMITIKAFTPIIITVQKSR